MRPRLHFLGKIGQLSNAYDLSCLARTDNSAVERAIVASQPFLCSKQLLAAGQRKAIEKQRCLIVCCFISAPSKRSQGSCDVLEGFKASQ